MTCKEIIVLAIAFILGGVVIPILVNILADKMGWFK